MKKTNYRDIRSTPPRVGKLSELENDLDLVRPEDITRTINETALVTSVNGLTGDVNLNIPTEKRIETYLGVTDSSGNYKVTYQTPYTTVPDIQPQLQSGTSSQVVRITSNTVDGFIVNVTDRPSTTLLAVEVQLASTTPVRDASISVLVTAR